MSEEFDWEGINDFFSNFMRDIKGSFQYRLAHLLCYYFGHKWDEECDAMGMTDQGDYGRIGIKYCHYCLESDEV